MDKDVIIKVENLHKKFSRNLKRSMLHGSIDVAKNMFGVKNNSGVLRKGEFWSLKDLNFEVKKGEALGVIGQNGSGKTTLLRLINGIFPPDKGKISFRGRLGALISIGAGFHPHMTGRENIFLNGAILGMTKKEILAKYDQIIDFADIGNFLDSPIATYSSGMNVRLGFSIAIHSDPDILLADEGLSVGDMAFGLKCYRKIAEYRREGGTIVLVSHGMSLVRNSCQKALWIDKGEAVEYGDVQKVCDSYENFMVKKDSHSNTDKGAIINNDPLTRITKVEFLDKNDQKQDEYNFGEPFKARIYYSCKREVIKPTFSITIHNPENIVPICHFSFLDGALFEKIYGDGYVDFKLNKLTLKASEYRTTVTFTENNDINNNLDWHDKNYSFIVKANNVVTYGLYNPFPEWELNQNPNIHNNAKT